MDIDDTIVVMAFVLRENNVGSSFQWSCVRKREKGVLTHADSMSHGGLFKEGHILGKMEQQSVLFSDSEMKIGV